MAGTDPTSTADSTGSLAAIDPGLAEGRSRIFLFVGMGGLGLGSLLEMAPAVWAGALLVLIAFSLNTVGKLTHYRELPVPPRQRLALAASWTLLALSAVGSLVVFVSSRYGPRQGSFFWPLAIAAVGFSLLHMGAQSTYLPESEVPAEE